MEKLIRRGRRTIHLFDIRTADLVEHGYDSRSVCARNFLKERDQEMDPYTDPDTDLGPGVCSNANHQKYREADVLCG